MNFCEVKKTILNFSLFKKSILIVFKQVFNVFSFQFFHSFQFFNFSILQSFKTIFQFLIIFTNFHFNSVFKEKNHPKRCIKYKMSVCNRVHRSSCSNYCLFLFVLFCFKIKINKTNWVQDLNWFFELFVCKWEKKVQDEKPNNSLMKSFENL